MNDALSGLSVVPVKHTKIPGFVQSIEGPNRWWARLVIDGVDYEAQMIDELPAHAQEGSYFTIHRTKRGRTYIYWITTPWTKRQLKKARQRADQWAKELSWV
jgi:hypothetical protein